MEDIQIENVKKGFKIIWIIMALILVIGIIVNSVSYSKYKAGQDLMIESYIVAADSYEYSLDDYKENRKDYIEDIYNDVYYSGGYANESYFKLINKTNQNVQSALEDVLLDYGYDDDLEYYFKYTNFFTFFIGNNIILLSIYGVLMIFFSIITIKCIWAKKDVIEVKDDNA